MNTPDTAAVLDAQCAIAKTISDAINLPWQDAMKAAKAIAALAGQADAGGQEAVAEVGHDDTMMRLSIDPLPVGTKLYTAPPSAMPVDALPADIAQSMKFYGVDSLVELARIQSQHVERLQEKLPPPTDNHPRNPRGA